MSKKKKKNLIRPSSSLNEQTLSPVARKSRFLKVQLVCKRRKTKILHKICAQFFLRARAHVYMCACACAQLTNLALPMPLALNGRLVLSGCQTGRACKKWRFFSLVRFCNICYSVSQPQTQPLQFTHLWIKGFRPRTIFFRPIGLHSCNQEITDVVHRSLSTGSLELTQIVTFWNFDEKKLAVFLLFYCKSIHIF